MPCIDRHGERGAVAAFVARRHRRQVELPHGGVVQAETDDDAAAIPNQGGHHVAGESLRGGDEIGFVLPVVIVLQHDGDPGAQGGQGGFDAFCRGRVVM